MVQHGPITPIDGALRCCEGIPHCCWMPFLFFALIRLTPIGMNFDHQLKLAHILLAC